MTMITDAKVNAHNRMVQGAMRYAKADRCDPFALARALTHIRVGICDTRPTGEDAYYNAQPKPEGGYHSMVRP